MKLHPFCCAVLMAAITASGSVFATIKPASLPTEPFNGSDYVGIINAAIYGVENNEDGQQELLILTTPDSKNTDSQIASFNLLIDGKDLPWGYVLANSVGKKIAVTFTGGYNNIATVEVVTDEYYYSKNQNIRNHQ